MEDRGLEPLTSCMPCKRNIVDLPQNRPYNTERAITDRADKICA
jgi:hypothetical protein